MWNVACRTHYHIGHTRYICIKIRHMIESRVIIRSPKISPFPFCLHQQRRYFCTSVAFVACHSKSVAWLYRLALFPLVALNRRNLGSAAQCVTVLFCAFPLCPYCVSSPVTGLCVSSLQLPDHDTSFFFARQRSRAPTSYSPRSC